MQSLNYSYLPDTDNDIEQTTNKAPTYMQKKKATCNANNTRKKKLDKDSLASINIDDKDVNNENYEKLQEGLEAMDTDEGDNLADFTKEFNPPQVSQSSKHLQEKEGDDKPVVDQDKYNQLHSDFSKQYYKQYKPYYDQVTNAPIATETRDEILRKINYMIALLEEQKDERTNHVTEEVILYMFLGVFLIFIVDSFSKTKRYSR